MGKRSNGEGTYGKKKIKGSEYFFHRDSNGKYTYAKTQKELIKKVNEKKLLSEQTPLIDNKYIFSDYCKIWLKTRRGEFADTTYDSYYNTIKYHIEGSTLGNRQLLTINEDIINQFLKKQADKYAKGTIDKMWNVIRLTLLYGIDEHVIPSINFGKIKKIKESQVAVKKKDVPFISMDDIEILYKEANRKTNNNTYFYGNASKVIIFIMYSGVRIGEAMALTWGCVADDFESVDIKSNMAKVVVRDDNGEPIINEDGNMTYVNVKKSTKTESGIRNIPLPNRAIEVLKYFNEINPRHKKNDLVFVTDNNTPYNKRGVERCLERMLKNSDCSCKDYTPHSLRHGYGSILLSKGIDIKVVSKLLGHKDITTTYNIYIGVYKEDEIKAIKNVFNTKEDNADAEK